MNVVVPFFFLFLDSVHPYVLVFFPFVLIVGMQVYSLVIMYFCIDFYSIKLYLLLKKKIHRWRKDDVI